MRNWFLLVIPIVAAGCAAVSEPRPVGQVGPDAERFAHTMLQRIDIAAWESTRAVTWTFGGKRNHLWDRERNYDRYRKGTLEVLLRLNEQTGIARDGEQVLAGDEASKALKEAWESWVNDSFWLNAPAKCFDEGTERSLVRDDTGDRLLVAYSAGGVTPGDAYLWEMSDGLPTAWKMWTQVIPLGGVKTTWEGWQKLDTGAWISTKHEWKARTTELTDVKGAATFAELVPGPDPFAALETP